MAFQREVHAEHADALFNMNALTAGTEFMEQLDAHVLFLIRQCMASNLIWKHLRVIYSGDPLTCFSCDELLLGSGIAGDSTFKIFEYIRSLRRDRAMTDVMTHCVYSTKHDTPLRALATREPYIYILKEGSHFKKPYLSL